MIDVFLIHGIGKKGASTAPYDELVQGVKKNLPSYADVVFHGIDYSDILDEREAQIFSWVKDMSPFYDVLARREREFICYYICDVLAYAYPKRPLQPGDIMFDLTKLLTDKLAQARTGAKTVIVGHSLGSIVGYGATWDVKTDCLITMGNPFSFFSVRYHKGGEMNPDLAEFHNFWTPRDRVSTIVSKNPKFTMVHDYEVPNWNPLNWERLKAHSSYWLSSFVHTGISKIVTHLEESK